MDMGSGVEKSRLPYQVKIRLWRDFVQRGDLLHESGPGPEAIVYPDACANGIWTESGVAYRQVRAVLPAVEGNTR
ncbi:MULTISPECIES: hypothetical protein [unclassified Rhizobium]|uniref:hypothetical protein n=1 Tax=unclassified Rhizobium TaxID=2613769 RepID=UPI001C83AEE1|nr:MULTISPECIES: hypothetical protein [unclassified Rhizobium]MBX5163931.1 hypothetical protein [Rhizobium sp. NZLR4b]MBX5207919.1 hypothetical protein [Rhizobium sp. NZLR11]